MKRILGLIFLAFSFIRISPAMAIPHQDFLWGAANSAFQVEGDPKDSDWYRWTHTPGKIQDGTNADRATDFLNWYEKDFEIAQATGMNAFRISIAWERVEPAPGQWDENALDHYARILTSMRSHGLEPVVTLFHWAIPGWLADKGGMLAPDFAPEFARYCEKVVKRLALGSGRVVYWMTLNEPMIVVQGGYIEGGWPPGKTDVSLAFKAAAALAKAHIEAVGKIRDLGIDGLKISIAQNWPVFDPVDSTPQSQALAASLTEVFDHQFVKSIVTGHIFFGGLPGTQAVDETVALPGGKSTLDYLGINNYGRTMVAATEEAPFYLLSNGPGPKNDVGWELYPEGMYRAIVAASVYKLPMMISEFGTADQADRFRPKYLEDHYQVIERLLREGYPLFGCLHWSLTDNFEWASGLAPRFGLVEIDYATLERKPRPSLKVYGDLIRKFRATH